jgi:cytochrome c553
VRSAERSGWARWASIAVAVVLGMLLPGVPAALADDFAESLKRVDSALVKNPSRVSPMALDSCRSRRNFAVKLYDQGITTRAERSLKFCFDLLEIPEKRPERAEALKATGPSMAEVQAKMAEVQAKAAREVEQAITLTPSVEKGLEVYRSCAMCHTPEGWGLSNGSVPQLAGQHRKVVIKQLADIRAGNRDNLLMLPYSSLESMGSAQSVADVAAYIDTLEINVDTGKGPGDDLELGERLYAEHCAKCHGARGEGDNDTFVPRIQSQHYEYLLRQFEWIRDGKRRNANPEMVLQIQNLEPRETHAILDYVSRLEPPKEFQAPPGWRNPDFLP